MGFFSRTYLCPFFGYSNYHDYCFCAYVTMPVCLCVAVADVNIKKLTPEEEDHAAALKENSR